MWIILQAFVESSSDPTANPRCICNVFLLLDRIHITCTRIACFSEPVFFFLLVAVHSTCIRIACVRELDFFFSSPFPELLQRATWCVWVVFHVSKCKCCWETWQMLLCRIYMQIQISYPVNVTATSQTRLLTSTATGPGNLQWQFFELYCMAIAHT